MPHANTPAKPVLLWLRRDLRLHDNPALAAAVATGRPLIVAFVLDEETPQPWAPGGASRWWLHHSLAALAEELKRRGVNLVLRRGRFAEVIPRLAEQSGAAEIHAGLPLEPWARKAMRALAKALPVRLHVHLTTLLHAPLSIRTRDGGPYGAFTPFARACLARGLPAPPVPAPSRLHAAPAPHSDHLDDWNLLPTKPDWTGGLRETWTPGEAGAARLLTSFVDHRLCHYQAMRDQPGQHGTSMLSPHLASGEISPATIWHQAAQSGGAGPGRFVNELLWREFSAHLLWHNEELPLTPLRREFDAMPWRHDRHDFAAWTRGQTGLPIVDAGMRQLWRIGWMHNRVRMIAASFLVKHLLLPWQEGERWFWDTLVDADLATNAALLAMGRRQRCRRGAVLPGVQPGAARPQVRRRRKLRPALGAGTGASAGPRPARAVGGVGKRASISRGRAWQNLSHAHRRPWYGTRPSPRGLRQDQGQGRVNDMPPPPRTHPITSLRIRNIPTSPDDDMILGMRRDLA